MIVSYMSGNILKACETIILLPFILLLIIYSIDREHTEYNMPSKGYTFPEHLR